MAQSLKHNDRALVNLLNCPVCNEPMSLVRVGTHSDGGPMNYYECKKCGGAGGCSAAGLSGLRQLNINR